ncbi:hypothetical protein FJ934_10855 [Mesorhizobium sp. B2-4-12]|uniref:hypothetical protein n=1 Tax=Mesorhizobium sp. B2-4-12 TaxID=2589937 RepID=UPI001127F984|nr:hypothetical protein [Mesorhizobium sp. B2-4-12]TPK96009.1 hypothetical protein FJ934_10855 [Mesorhizobium sp. B2-4-12]
MGEILTLERDPERSSDEITLNKERSLFRLRGMDHTRNTNPAMLPNRALFQRFVQQYSSPTLW